MRWARRLQAMVLVALLAAIHTSVARAEVRLQGDTGAVKLEASDASVDDVLAALSARFGVSYQSSSPLTRRITATFDGPLSSVVTRVLDGYDFVIKSSSGKLDVRVLSNGSPRPAIPAPIRHRAGDY